MIEVALIGVVAGVVAGLLGVGGGILFVPALVIVLDRSVVGAEATSLLAIIPVALVGAWRQRHYGNVRIRDAVLLGTLAAGGAIAGVAIANVVPARALEIGFAGVLLVTAFQLGRRSLKALGAARRG